MSTLSVSTMRGLIADVYSGPAWKEKVKFMPDKQVMAIYNSFLEKGKFDKRSGNTTANVEEREPVPVNQSYFVADTAEQLSFDI